MSSLLCINERLKRGVDVRPRLRLLRAVGFKLRVLFQSEYNFGGWRGVLVSRNSIEIRISTSTFLSFCKAWQGFTQKQPDSF